jgi:hypothetical protein
MKTSLVLAATLMAACILPAQARQAQAHASIQYLGYQLFDLAPGDGVAPSLTVTTGERNAYAKVWLTSAGTPVQLLDHHERDDAGAVGAAAHGASAQASTADDLVTGASTANGQRLSETGSSAFDRFILSPHTQVTFSWLANLSTTANLDNAGYSTVGYIVSLGDAVNGFIDWDGNSFSSAFNETRSDELITVTVRALDQVAQGSTDFYAFTRVEALPIPEPGQWAMLGAGILLVGALHLRGGSQAAIRRRFRSRFCCLNENRRSERQCRD